MLIWLKIIYKVIFPKLLITKIKHTELFLTKFPSQSTFPSITNLNNSNIQTHTKLSK